MSRNWENKFLGAGVAIPLIVQLRALFSQRHTVKTFGQTSVWENITNSVTLFQMIIFIRRVSLISTIEWNIYLHLLETWVFSYKKFEKKKITSLKKLLNKIKKN